MGFTKSKTETEEVLQCKMRMQFMERAITACNKFVAAHSTHATCLKNTGAALSDYAQGKTLYPSCGAYRGGGGDVILRPPINFSPPPLTPSFNQIPLPPQRASIVPEFGTEFIEDDQDEVEEIRRKMGEEEKAKKNEMDSEVDGGRRVEHVEVATEGVEGAMNLSTQPPPTQTAKELAKRVKMGALAEGSGQSNTNLLQIFGDLDYCFLKACKSADDVSRLLEGTRLLYHSNFDDKRDDRVYNFDSDATVLHKILRWEEKLYDEVKAGEKMKLEYQEKVALLNKLKKKHGSNIDALQRMNAEVSHLHTRRIVDMESMDFKVSEISNLCDGQLYPKLVALVDAMATMWETMEIYHEEQYKVVRALGQWDVSQSPSETSDLHHNSTRRLYYAVQELHTHFSALVSQQKEYVEALNEWMKLSIIHVGKNMEKVRGIQALLHVWHACLGKIPDEHTKDAISKFAVMIKTARLDQKEELNLKNKCAKSRERRMKRIDEYDKWHKEYVGKRNNAGKAIEEDRIAERRRHVEAAELQFQGDEDAYQIQCRQVRSKSMMSLKRNLPVLIQAMLDFAHACSDMYSNLRSIVHSQNRSQD